MASTIIDSAHLPATSSAATRCATSGPTRTAPQKYLDIEARAGQGPGPTRPHPEGSGRRDRQPLPSSTQIDMAKLRQQTERIGYPILGVVSQINALLPRQARRVLPLGRDHAGHHRHRRPCCRSAKASRSSSASWTTISRRDGRAREEAPRHADDRPQQPAAGHPDDLRLQDGRPPGGDRTSSRAPGATEAARARGRVRRRRRARSRRSRRAPWKPRPACEGARPGAAADRLAHDPRQHRRSRRLPRPGRRHARQDQRWTSS